MKKVYLFGLIFLISLALRFDAYFTNNSFFTDEVLLASNILDRDYLSLILPLNFFQSAPYLFLVFTKFLVNIFGYSELVFRFIPFVSSILSLVLFYFVCDLFFKNIWTKAIALLTFGVSYQILFYSQAFKQYSSDVMFTILTLYLVFKFFDKFNTIKEFTLLGIYSFFSMFCSFPMFIILPAIYTSLVISKPKKILLILYTSVFYFLGAGIYYFFNLRLVKSNEMLQNYWQKGFEIFKIQTYQLNFDFLFFYFAFSILLLILILWGFYKLIKEKSAYFYPVFFIIFYTLLFAGLKLYPLERRLALFIFPVILLISLVPLDRLKKNFTSLIAIVISLIFLFTGYFNFSKDLFTKKLNYLRQDVKPLLEIISNDNKKIYLYYGSIYVYNYYSLFKDLPKNNVILGSYPYDENDSETYLIDDLSKLKQGNYYLLFIKGTGTYDKDLKFTEKWLKSNARVKKDVQLKSTRLIEIEL